MSGPSISRGELLLRVAVAAFIGALSAVVVLAVKRDITHPRLLAVVVLVAIAFCVLAAGTQTSSTRSAAGWDTAAGRATRADPGRASGADRGRASGAAARRAAGAEPGRPAFAWSGRSAGPTTASGTHPVTGADRGTRADRGPAADRGTAADSVTAASPGRPRWRPPPVAATEAPAPPRRSGPDPAPVNVAVPVHGGAWWQATVDGGSRPATDPTAASGSGDQPAATLPDLADAGLVTQVVQCPRCGDFTVEIRRQQPGFAFGCAQCGHQWRWEPGAAWPAGVVRPSLGRRSAPGPGSRSS